jgi:hypothetical protein
LRAFAHSFQCLPSIDFTAAEPPAQRLTISLTSRSFLERTAVPRAAGATPTKQHLLHVSIGDRAAVGVPMWSPTAGAIIVSEPIWATLTAAEPAAFRPAAPANRADEVAVKFFDLAVRDVRSRASAPVAPARSARARPAHNGQPDEVHRRRHHHAEWREFGNAHC